MPACSAILFRTCCGSGQDFSRSAVTICVYPRLYKARKGCAGRAVYSSDRPPVVPISDRRQGTHVAVEVPTAVRPRLCLSSRARTEGLFRYSSPTSSSAGRTSSDWEVPVGLVPVRRPMADPDAGRSPLKAFSPDPRSPQGRRDFEQQRRAMDSSFVHRPYRPSK